MGRILNSILARIFSLAILFGGGLAVLVFMPNSPLPNAWNPTIPLDVNDDLTLLTDWKLRRALGDTDACLAALRTGANFDVLPEKRDTNQCFIRDHVALSSLQNVHVDTVNTRCQTALRWTMWVTHSLQPTSERLLDSPITEIHHFSSYNCREIRTTNGARGRMSTHATAEAIDVSGFSLEDGSRISLKEHWSAAEKKSLFLKAARDSACRWFRVTLSPDYNKLHADHFHLQHTGWGLCR